jgi:folate-binding protein YgfZ
MPLIEVSAFSVYSAVLCVLCGEVLVLVLVLLLLVFLWPVACGLFPIVLRQKPTAKSQWLLFFYNQMFVPMTQTALYPRLASWAQARTGMYNGAETVLGYADPAAELGVLTSGCGLFDLGWRAKITVGGKDRTRWLNGMVSNTIKDLPPGHGNYSFLLNPQGRILADMYAYNRGEYLVLDTDRSQLETVINTLKRFIIMDKVELTDSSDTLIAIGLCGPKSQQALKEAGIDADRLEPLELRDAVVNQIGLTVVRGPQQKPGWYEIWAGREKAEPLWEMLVKDVQPVGADAVELWRIVHGIPRYGQDIRDRDLPQETEQNQALNFTKGCYIGQEIVERIRSRGQVHRKFTGFEFQDALPQPGKFEEGGRTVAEITSVAEIGNKKIGLGYVRRDTGTPGATVNLGGITGTVVDPPFA